MAEVKVCSANTCLNLTPFIIYIYIYTRFDFVNQFENKVKVKVELSQVFHS